MAASSFDPAAELQVDDRRNPFTGRAWDVVLCLLSEPQRPWTNAQITSATGLSRGFVSRVLTSLTSELPDLRTNDEYQATARLLEQAAAHWPRPVAYLKSVESPPQREFPIGGAFAATTAGYTGGDLTNVYIRTRKQAYEVAATMTGGFVEQHLADAAITILNSHLLPPGPLPVWAYAVELCSTSRGAEIWEHTTNQHLAAYRQALR